VCRRSWRPPRASIRGCSSVRLTCRNCVTGKDGRSKMLVDRTASARRADKVREGKQYTMFERSYGFLYQMTGEKKYADWRAITRQFWTPGTVDKDDRYSLVPPTSQCCRPGLYAVALA